MKKLKKLLALGLCFVMLTSLVGCSKNSSDSDASTGGKKKLVLATFNGGPSEIDGLNIFERMVQTYGWKWAEENNVELVLKYYPSDYDSSLRADIAAGDYPDLFVFESDQDFSVYKEIMAELDGSAWIEQTDYAYESDGHVYGFPYAVEGYGLAYNKDILDKAGIDPESLTTISAYKEAFEILWEKKDELGITAPLGVSCNASSYWMWGNHDLAAYTSSGLAYDDTSVVEDANKGIVDEERLNNYAEWVTTLFSGIDERMLTSGTEEECFTEFMLGKYAFMHQGTWADEFALGMDASFNMGMAPYAGTGDEACDGLFIGASLWLAVCNQSENVDLAKDFLEHFATDDEVLKCQAEGLSLISPFKNNTYRPSGPLASFLSEWISEGRPAYSFNNQYKLPDGFNIDTLGPIYGELALGKIDKQGFIDLVSEAIENIAK